MNQLALAFVGNRRALPEDVAGLAERLDRIHQQARAAWPGIELSAEEFARYLGEKLADDPSQLTKSHPVTWGTSETESSSTLGTRDDTEQ
jgi:hypothetical protein